MTNAPAAPPDAGRVQVPPDIDQTGATDVTDALNEFFVSVRAGTVVEFPRRARYRIDGTLRVAGKHDIVIEGNGALTFAEARGEGDRSHWLIRKGSNVRIHDLVVRGVLPAGTGYDEDLESQHGFRLEGVQGFELDGVTVTDVYGDFVYVGRDHEGRGWSDDVRIHDNVFERNGRQGIAVTAARNVVIERNEISQTGRATIDLEPNVKSAGAENIVIRNNSIGPGRLLFVAIGKSEGSIRNVTIEGNELHGRPLSIIIAGTENRRPSNVSIVDNRSDSLAEREAFKLHNIDGLVVTGNSSAVARPYEPMRIVNCTNVVTEPNDFWPANK